MQKYTQQSPVETKIKIAIHPTNWMTLSDMYGYSKLLISHFPWDLSLVV